MDTRVPAPSSSSPHHLVRPDACLGRSLLWHVSLPGLRRLEVAVVAWPQVAGAPAASSSTAESGCTCSEGIPPRAGAAAVAVAAAATSRYGKAIGTAS
jgi:hypothetical protein